MEPHTLVITRTPRGEIVSMFNKGQHVLTRVCKAGSFEIEQHDILKQCVPERVH